MVCLLVRVQVCQRSSSAAPAAEHLPDEMDALFRASTGHFEGAEPGTDDDDVTYTKLAYEAALDLYPGCNNFSKLQFIVRLLNIKKLWGAANGMFDEILQLLAEAFPEGNQVPKSYYDSNKFVKDVGIGYNNIDACINDCVLYMKELAVAKECPTCGTSR